MLLDLSKIFGKQKNSKDVAKERLKLVLIHDRANVSPQFLEMLKWMWIQEDLNYKLSWREVGSKMPYRLQNRNGGPTSKGAGRDKFYAALILVHGNYFDAASMRKIIP